MSDRIRWRYTKQELYNTGSRKCGILEEKELNYRQQAANYIRDMGHSLNQPQLCINTAIVYMHRFYMYHSFSRFHQFGQNTIAPAALFLASKVEEHPKRLEAVIKAAHKLVVKEGPPLDLRSSEYQRLAEEAETNETILLQTLGFDLVVDHAHTHILKCCKIFKANKDELTRAAYNIASESLYLTTMCLEYSATAIACFCIYLACKWTNWEIPCSSEGKPWWWYVDNTVTPELLQKMTTEFLNIFDKSPSRLKQKIRSSAEQFSKRRNSRMANNSSVQDHRKLEHSPTSDESRSSASSRFQASLDQEAESSPKPAQMIPFQDRSALRSPNLGFDAEYTIRRSSSDSSRSGGNGTVIRHGRTEYIPAALGHNPDKNSSISSAIQNSFKQDKNLNSSIKNNCTQVSQPPPLRRDSSHNQATHRIRDKPILRPQQNIESAKKPSGTIREGARSLHEKLPEYKIRKSSTPPVDFSNIFNAKPVQNNDPSFHEPLQIAQNPEIHPQIPRTTNIKTEQPSAEKIPVHRPGTLFDPQESNELEAPSNKKELISPTKSISSILRQAQAPLPSLLSSLDSGYKSTQNSNNDKSSHLNHTSNQNSNNDTSYHLNHTSSQNSNNDTSSHSNHTSSQNSNNDTSYHLNHTSSQNSSKNSNKYASYHLNNTSSRNSIQNSNNDTSYHLNHTSSHNLIHNSNQNLNQVSSINSNHNLSQHSNDTLPSLPTMVSPLSSSSDPRAEECEAHSVIDGPFSSPIDVITTDGNIFFPGIFDVQENVEVEAESTDKKKKKKEKKDKHKERSKEKKKSKHKEKKDKNKDKYKEKNKTEAHDCGPIKIKIPMEKITLPPQTKNTENRAPGGLKLTLKIPKERIQSDIHEDSAGHQVHGSLKIKIRTSGGACESSGRSKRSVELVNIDDSPTHKRARV